METKPILKSRLKRWQTQFYDPEPRYGGWFDGDIVVAETEQMANDVAFALYRSKVRVKEVV